MTLLDGHEEGHLGCVNCAVVLSLCLTCGERENQACLTIADSTGTRTSNIVSSSGVKHT